VLLWDLVHALFVMGVVFFQDEDQDEDDSSDTDDDDEDDDDDDLDTDPLMEELANIDEPENQDRATSPTDEGVSDSITHWTSYI